MKNKKVAVITSGGFDPIHEGHIEYLERAKELAEDTFHICIVNSGVFLNKKKGYAFYSEKQRLKIVSSLRCVDSVFLSVDEDMTVCESISIICKTLKLKENYDEVIFAKGGDRYSDEIPEAETCKKLGIKIIDNLGEKVESSSNLIKRLKENEKKRGN